MLRQSPPSRHNCNNCSNLLSKVFSAVEHGALSAMGNGAWERNASFSFSEESKEIGRAEVTKCNFAESPDAATAMQRMTFSGHITAEFDRSWLKGNRDGIRSNKICNLEIAEASDSDISQRSIGRGAKGSSRICHQRL